MQIPEDNLKHSNITEKIIGVFYDVYNDLGECVIVELKTVRALDPSHEAQLFHYLRSTKIEVGLLLNFGPRPQRPQ